MKAKFIIKDKLPLEEFETQYLYAMKILANPTREHKPDKLELWNLHERVSWQRMDSLMWQIRNYLPHEYKRTIQKALIFISKMKGLILEDPEKIMLIEASTPEKNKAPKPL